MAVTLFCYKPSCFSYVNDHDHDHGLISMRIPRFAHEKPGTEQTTVKMAYWKSNFSIFRAHPRTPGNHTPTLKEVVIRPRTLKTARWPLQIPAERCLKFKNIDRVVNGSSSCWNLWKYDRTYDLEYLQKSLKLQNVEVYGWNKIDGYTQISNGFCNSELCISLALRDPGLKTLLLRSVQFRQFF